MDPRCKAKVAWRGGDPLFHHKLPTVCLRFGLSTFVRVAEWSWWAVSEYCCQRLARSLRSPALSSRYSYSDRQRLSNVARASERSVICGGAERRAREGGNGELGTKRRNACYYDYYYYYYYY